MEFIYMLSGAILSVLGGYYANKIYWEKKDKDNFLALTQGVIDELESNKKYLTEQKAGFCVSVENFKNLEKDPCYIRYCPVETRGEIKGVYADLREVIGQSRRGFQVVAVKQYLTSQKNKDIEKLVNKLTYLLKINNK